MTKMFLSPKTPGIPSKCGHEIDAEFRMLGTFCSNGRKNFLLAWDVLEQIAKREESAHMARQV
jgi:hypothetical protein